MLKTYFPLKVKKIEVLSVEVADFNYLKKAGCAVISSLQNRK